MIPDDARLALLMHDKLAERPGEVGFGKLGRGVLRYGRHEVVAVIDRSSVGSTVNEVTGIEHGAPVVADVAAAAERGADTLVIAISPHGGRLPEDFRAELVAGARRGMSIVNGLHLRLDSDPELVAALAPGRWIWDVRREPDELAPASGAAAELAARRVLAVGTDMAVGKMTASLELDRAARARGMRSRFVASGQTGICIAGDGVALDAVRIDFAGGAVEAAVMRHGDDNDLLWVEGQGSILHPASSAWLPLMRGSRPTDLVLCHRAGQTHIDRYGVDIPELTEVADLYERVAAIVDDPGPRVRAVALNTAHLDERAARAAISATAAETSLVVDDPVRFGADRLLDAVMA